MTCYVLEIKPDAPLTRRPHQRVFKKVVKAGSILLARKVASEQADCMKPFDSPALWSNSRYSTCQNIDAPTMAKGVICEETI